MLSLITSFQLPGLGGDHAIGTPPKCSLCKVLSCSLTWACLSYANSVTVACLLSCSCGWYTHKRPCKVDLLFSISPLLNLHAGRCSLFIRCYLQVLYTLDKVVKWAGHGLEGNELRQQVSNLLFIAILEFCEVRTMLYRVYKLIGCTNYSPVLAPSLQTT